MEIETIAVEHIESVAHKDIGYHLEHSFTKRSFDLLFSSSVLIVLSPLFIGISAAIWLTSGEKPIYIQPRVGQGGQTFQCYKFRTMYADADVMLPELLKSNPALRHEWKKNQKLQEDPRIFPVGKWLRKTSLDELPQFWNVFKGDLSVVGPRPYMVSQKMQLGRFTSKILCVKPGITGLWQTSGRSKTTFQERIILDAEYATKRSFWYDFKLILKTIPAMLNSDNAY